MNDQERCHGFVRAVEAVSDGLNVVVAVDELVDARLDRDPADPMLATDVRLIESYRTSAGQQFPLVLAMVYTTTTGRPALAGLRPWTRENQP